MHGQDITLSRLAVNGKALDGVSRRAACRTRQLDLNWAVGLADLAAIQPSLSGKMDAKGHAGGKLDDLAVQADIGADLAAKGYSSGHITAKVDATGLPSTPRSHRQRRRHVAGRAAVAGPDRGKDQRRDQGRTSARPPGNRCRPAAPSA